MGRLETGWRGRVRRYPGDWFLAALALLAIAAVGAALAIVSTRERERATTLVATMPVAEEGPATGSTHTAAATDATTGMSETAPGAGTGTSPSPSPPPSPPPAPPAPARAGALVQWPAGRSGYTIVLRSLPTADGRARAVSEARRAAGAGLADVGVIDSSDYSSLHPGYYVVFSGIYETFQDAEEAADDARVEGFDDAYPARVSR